MHLSLAFCISAVVWVQSFSERYYLSLKLCTQTTVSWNPTDSSYRDWRKTCRRL